MIDPAQKLMALGVPAALARELVEQFDQSGNRAPLLAVKNLSDLKDVLEARNNLGLGTAATKAAEEFATSAQGSMAETAVQPEQLDDALEDYAPLESPAFTGTVTGITKSMVGLGNVDNTSDIDKPVSTAQAEAIQEVRDDLAADTGAGLVGYLPYGTGAVATDVQSAIRALAFDSVADMKAALNLKVGMKARTLGYYAPGDGGGNDYEIVAAATGSDDGGSFIDLAGSGLQAKGLFANGYVDVRQFGALGDGVRDDTVSVQNADNYSDFVLVDGTYAISSVVLANGFTLRNAAFKSLGTTQGRTITLTSTFKHIPLLHLDHNDQSINGIVVEGSNTTIGTVIVENVTSTSESGPTIGIAISANNCFIDSLHFYNFYNTDNPNASMPQCLYSNGDNNHYGSVKGVDTVATIVTGFNNTYSHIFDHIDLTGSVSNGVYMLGGKANIGLLRFKSGNGQPLVVKDGSTATVDAIHVHGKSAAVVGLQDSGDININSITVSPDAEGNSTYSILRTRSGSVACGKVHIGNIKAVFTGSTFIFLDIGTVEKLSLGPVDVDFTLLESGSETSWFDLAGCKEFDIRGGRISISDPSSLNTFDLSMIAPTLNLTRPSFITVPEVVKVDNVGFRGVSFNNELISVRNARWSANFGPYISNAAYNNGVPNSTNMTPTIGFWKAGTDLALSNATTAPFRTRCTVSGTPGTWVEY